jgi:hypothetical protein
MVSPINDLLTLWQSPDQCHCQAQEQRRGGRYVPPGDLWAKGRGGRPLTEILHCVLSAKVRMPNRSLFLPLWNAKKQDVQGVAVLPGRVIAKAHLQ